MQYIVSEKDVNKRRELYDFIHSNYIIKDKKQNTIFKYIMIVVTVLILIGGSLFTYQLITGKTNLNIKYIRKMEITAPCGLKENTVLPLI